MISSRQVVELIEDEIKELVDPIGKDCSKD